VHKGSISRNPNFFQETSFCVLQVLLRSFTNSVVTVTAISPPPRWLATTEPPPPPRCFTVLSAAFLGAVFWKLHLTIPGDSQCRVIWSRMNAVHSRERTLLPPARSSHCSIKLLRPMWRIYGSLRCEVKFSSRRCEWGRKRICHCRSTKHYSAGGRVTRAAGPHVHLALPTSSAPLPATQMACFSCWQRWHNYTDFTAADILASRLVLTTGGSATPTWALILPPGNVLLNGYLDAGLPVNSAMDEQSYLWHRPPAPRWHVNKNTATDRVANSHHRNNTIYQHTLAIVYWFLHH